MSAQLGKEQEAFHLFLCELRAQAKLDDPLERIREKAWQHFQTLGLPSKQTEVYRYIKLRHLFSQSYQEGKEKLLKFDDFQDAIYPECQRSVLVFVNGHYTPELSCTEAIPSKVVISTLQDASQTFGTLLQNHWTKNLKEETDAFVTLNGALHGKGAFVYIPPKIVVETPIQILHLMDQDDVSQMAMPRMHIFAGSQANARFIRSQKNFSSLPYFMNGVMEFILEEGAHLHYIQNLCEGEAQSWLLEAVRASLKRDSTLKTVCVTEGGFTTRTDYKVLLTGENAEALLNGLAILGEKREAHTNIWIEHQAPFCRSYQLFKNVLNDFSRSSFEGKIMVRQKAQKTEAFQLNNNLLMSDHAHADSKPNLEIFADDVKASHGATVGQLDPEQLFYMRARGFSLESAKNLLIHGFCQHVTDMIPLPSLHQKMTKKTQNYLAPSPSSLTLSI